MTDAGDEGGTFQGVSKYAVIYTLLLFAVGFSVVMGFNQQKETVAYITYAFHAFFYSLCLGGLFAVMFHAIEKD